MIYRIDVRTTPAVRDHQASFDPVGEAIRHQIHEFGTDVGPITTTRVFLIDTDADTRATKLGENLLCRLRAAAGLDQDHQDADV